MSIYYKAVELLEKDLFEKTLSENQFNVARTARVLGISRGSLNMKLKAYFDTKYIGTRDNYKGELKCQ